METRAGTVVIDENSGGTGKTRALQFLVLFALMVLLPGMLGSVFVWLYMMLPIAVLYSMYRWQYGFRLVLGGLAGAGVISVITGSLGSLIIACLLVPGGYILANSALQADTPARSGLKGTVALITCCLLLFGGQTLLYDSNPVSVLLDSLDHDVEEAIDYYRQSDSFTPDTLAVLEQSFVQMKAVVPKIIPALLASLALFVTWTTMIAGNRVVKRLTGYQPWPEHTTWKLPDRLVWLFIAATVAALLPLGIIRLIGINLLIMLSLVYVFQGFSVLSFFLHKWNTPLALRFFIYGMMLFQSFGTMLLLAGGLADVWFDMRRLRTAAQPPTDSQDPPAR